MEVSELFFFTHHTNSHHFLGNVGKGGARQIPTIRVRNYSNLGCGINIYQKTWNGLFENLEHGINMFKKTEMGIRQSAFPTKELKHLKFILYFDLRESPQPLYSLPPTPPGLPPNLGARDRSARPQALLYQVVLLCQLRSKNKANELSDLLACFC